MENSSFVGAEAPPAALTAALLAEARTLLVRGDLSGARTVLTTAAAADPTPAARYRLAELLADSGEITTAMRTLEAAWDQARTLGSAVWRARCCHALADLSRLAGLHDRADRYRQWAIRAELDADLDISTADWLLDRAEESLAACDPAAAQRALRAAGRMLPATDSARLRLEFAQGVLLSHEGRWAQGLRSFVRAFQRARIGGDLRGCAIAARNVAAILQSRGRWRRAEAGYRHAARLLTRIGDHEGAALADRYARECARLQAAETGDPEWN